MGGRILSSSIKDISRPVHTILYAKDTIQDALSLLQKKRVDEKIFYFYVVDEKNHLMGVVPARKLLLSSPDMKIEQLMEGPVISLGEEQKLEDAFKIFHERNLLALPVVDREGALVGAIDVEGCLEQNFDIAKPSNREDIYQLMGLTLEEKASIWRKFFLRMPWIMCNVVGGVLCALISYYYGAILSKTLLLVMFIPLVLSLSEAISMQSMVQSLQLVKRSPKNHFSIFIKSMKELKLIILMAACTGILVGLISFFWERNPLSATIIALGITLSVCATALLGAVLPLFLHRMELDPKIASGPLVLGFSDVLTMVIYLSLAMVIVF
jgi:magnesium transporter